MFLQLFDQFVRHSSHASWRQINKNRQDFLGLGIRSMIVFELDTFTRLCNEYKGGFWLGADPATWYALAVQSKNLSASKAWEHHFQVEPFILHKQRLAPGQDMIWQGHLVKITSITAERLIACDKDKAHANRRYVITHADLQVRNKEIADFLKTKVPEWQAKLDARRIDMDVECQAIVVDKVRWHVEALVQQIFKQPAKVTFHPVRGFECAKWPSRGSATESDLDRRFAEHLAYTDGLVSREARDYTARLIEERLQKAA